MKTPEELNALKEEVKTMNKKLAELSEDELAQVSGGITSMQGIGVEKGECFELDTLIVVYEGETTFLPITQSITLDMYTKDIANLCNFECRYIGSTSLPIPCLLTSKSLGNKGSIQYRLKK